MNWDVIEGKWDQVKGHLRSQWGKLTDDDVSTVGGKKDSLVGKLQERYGLMKDDAERQIDAWLAKLDTHGHTDAKRDVDVEEDTQPRVARPRTPGAPPR